MKAVSWWKRSDCGGDSSDVPTHILTLLLIVQDHVQAELSRMMDQVIQETASRGKAEKDKATIEKELAELSSQLFQEANQMVALERMQRLRAESKMNQLEQNLKDTESMMSGQSEQMRGLGGKLEEIEHERDELKKQVEEAQAAATAAAQSAAAISRPYQPTPGNQFTSPPDANNNAVPGTPGGGYRSLQQAAMTIKHPLQYLALDVQPYFEFVVFTKGMARIRKNIVDRRYMNSISESGGMTPGIGSFASAYGQSSSAGHGAHTVTSPKMTQYQSMILKQDQAEALAEALPLSQYTSFPFLKRAQDEDLVATLHLDDAPGLSFFSRGKISNAIIDGQLAIEPAYISLPSDQCCLCGSSLQRFIASHQSTAPKEDPRKKLTRLATGWIPGSGNSTPIKDAQGFTMSALSSALEALTPAKELAGFSFGMSSSNDTSTQNKRLSMSAGPGAGNNNVLSGPRPRDSERNALSASVGASGRPSTGDGSTTSFPLIAAARQNAQVYLFRTQDSDTKYAICPTYCLPRLRAVCDLFTYIRTIQRGLLMEDAPKFLAPAAVSEYGQHTRRLSNQMPPMSATAARGGFATPLATPMLNANRQLVAPAENMKPAGNGNGGASSSTNGSTSTGGTAGLGLTSESTNEAGPVTGLGLDIQKKDFAFTSQNPSTSSLFSEDGTANSSSTAPTSTASSMDGQSAEGQSVAASDRGPSRRPSVEVQTPDGHHKPLVGNDTVHTPAGDQPFKLVLPPSRPRRNTDRPGPSAPGTPTMPSGETVSAVASASSSVPQTQQKSEAPPNAQSTADQPAAAPTAPTSVPVATSAPTMAPPPTSATGNAPPRLPPRNASQQSVNTGSAPRLPTRPPLSKLSTSMSGTTPGSLMAASAAGAAVSASAAGWQEKCWFEVVRLKEATL